MSMSRGNPWNQFQREYGGQGYTRQQMSDMYHQSWSQVSDDGTIARGVLH